MVKVVLSAFNGGAVAIACRGSLVKWGCQWQCWWNNSRRRTLDDCPACGELHEEGRRTFGVTRQVGGADLPDPQGSGKLA